MGRARSEEQSSLFLLLSSLPPKGVIRIQSSEEYRMSTENTIVNEVVLKALSWERDYMERIIGGYAEVMSFADKAEAYLKGTKTDYTKSIHIDLRPSAVYINVLEGGTLTTARKFLRAVLGSWHDRISFISPGESTVTVYYINDDIPLFRITVTHDRDNFPKKLLPDEDCYFEEYDIPASKGVRLVCKN